MQNKALVFRVFPHTYALPEELWYYWQVGATSGNGENGWQSEVVEQGKFVDLNGDSLPDIVWIMSLDNHYTVQIFLQKNANWEKTYCYSTCNGCPHWPAVHTKTNDSSPLSLPSWNPSTLLQDVGASPFPSDVLTVREAAKFLRISVAEITNLLEAGKVRGKKLAAGWRISKGALLSFLEL